MIKRLQKRLRELEAKEAEIRSHPAGPQEEALTRLLDEREDVQGRLAAYQRLAALSRGEAV